MAKCSFCKYHHLRLTVVGAPGPADGAARQAPPALRYPHTMTPSTRAIGLTGEFPNARVRAWLVREGERIEPGRAALEVESDSGAAQASLAGEGILVRRLVAQGDLIPSGGAVAIVATVVDDDGAASASARVRAAPDAPSEPQALLGSPAPGSERDSGTALTVVPPRRLAKQLGPTRHIDHPLPEEAERAASRVATARLHLPYGTFFADVDATALVSYCERLNHVLGPRGRVRPLDLALKATGVTLRRVPALNATYLGRALRYYTHIRLGLATFRGDDIAAPGIADVDLKTLGALAEEARELEARARLGDLTAAELSPPAVAVCDVGSLGIDRADILAGGVHTAVVTLGRIRKEPVARGDSVAVGRRLALTLACDERVAPAPTAARFLGELVTLLEGPESLAL